MTTIRTLLASDQLATGDAELRRRDGQERFGQYLPDTSDQVWARALSLFVRSTPWRYWDQKTVDEALAVLEKSVDRTAEAITHWAHQVGTGVDSLFKTSSAAEYEESLDINKPRDLLRLATEFHPDYLRYAEHTFSNLLTTYWSVLRRGSVTGKFDLRGAVSLLNSQQKELLTAGYDDRVRNAIAHGETVFRGEGLIQYGRDIANYTLTPFEFLSRYDELCRTSNALVLGLFLFLARNENNLLRRIGFKLPITISVFLASAAVERPGLDVLASIESETPRGGKRLHVFLKSNFRWRVQVLTDCARLSMYLIDHGAADYSRHVYDINHGQSVSSLVMVKPDRLAELLRDDAPSTRLSEPFDENLLLWYDETRVRHSLKAARILVTSRYQVFKEDFLREMAKAGVQRSLKDYRIRKVENASVSGIRRVRVTAVLRNPSDANDRERIKQIISSIVTRISKVKVKTNPSGVEKRWSIAGYPSYIWVWLYIVDGSFRWLSNGGWQSGNLVAMAEKLRNVRQSPILVPKPEEIWRGIRFRYSMDIEAYSEAMENLAHVVDRLI